MTTMIAAGSLIDVLSDGPAQAGAAPFPPEERVRLANEMIAAALDQRAHLEAMDTYGPRRKSRRFLGGPNAPLFRKALEDWLSSATTLLASAERLHASGHDVDRLRQLKSEVFSTRGLLSFTPEKIEEGMARIRGGDYVTLEELRRDLRAQGDK
jgi:hypothetical protein